MWIVRSEYTDRKVAGPFDTYAEADAYAIGFDDVYPAEVLPEPFTLMNLRDPDWPPE